MPTSTRHPSRHARLAGALDDRGFTLVEMLVAMVVFSVVVIAVVQLIGQSSKTAFQTSQEAKRNVQLTSAMTVVQRHLTEAFSPIINAGETGSKSKLWGNEMVFEREEHLSGGPLYITERLAWTKTSGTEGEVIAQVKTSTISFPSGEEWSTETYPPRQLVAHMPEPTSTTPLFEYYETADSKIGELDTEYLKHIGMVNVRLTSTGGIAGPTGGANAMVTSVYLNTGSSHTPVEEEHKGCQELTEFINGFTASYTNETYSTPVLAWTGEQADGESQVKTTEAPVVERIWQVDTGTSERNPGECTGSGEACTFKFFVPNQANGKKPAPGSHVIHVWLEDEAKNLGPQEAAGFQYGTCEL